MKIHLRVDSSNEAHTRFTVFLNGAHCGQICSTTEEFYDLKQIFQMFCAWSKVDEFNSTGHAWIDPEDNPEDNKEAEE